MGLKVGVAVYFPIELNEPDLTDVEYEVVKCTTAGVKTSFKVTTVAPEITTGNFEGSYEATFTPDAAAYYFWIARSATAGLFTGGMIPVEVGEEKDIEDKVDALGTAEIPYLLQGECDVGMTPSTTTIDCADLAGHGDDKFNTGWELWVIHNDNSHGAAPEDEYKDITDYVSSTGVFTTEAFTQNVEENDVIFVVKVDSRAQDNFDALMAIIEALVFHDSYAYTPTSQSVSSAAETSLTAPASKTITYPTGATLKNAVLVASLKGTSQADAEHNIGLTLQRNFDAGGWTDVRDFTANPHMALNGDAVSDEVTLIEDLTSVITSSGKTLQFRWQVDSDNANEVHYLQNFMLKVEYDYGG